MASKAQVQPEEHNDGLADYEDEVAEETSAEAAAGAKAKDVKKGSYVGIHASGFRDFLLKPELLSAITDCGFEHPSEVQQEAIPQAIYGQDIICQAKSGMGKTAVFVLAALQLIQEADIKEGKVDTLVICHTRELAYQICKEFLRFSKNIPDIKVRVFYGGIGMDIHRQMLKKETPHIVIGTPGRMRALIDEKLLKVNAVKRFIIDECDQVLDNISMRTDVQAIFRATPHEKQVMLFSATINKELREVCKKFTQNALQIFIDDTKLTLHGLQQYYVKLEDKAKNRKLNDLLDNLEFNQVIIFVNGTKRCEALNKLLTDCNFPSICVYGGKGKGGLSQEERLKRYNLFKEYKSRIMVATDLFGRGVDFERVNIVINYDMPKDADSYLHRVGRSGRFGTKGLAISFVSTTEDAQVLEAVQARFEVNVKELPDEIDTSTYMS